MSPRRSQRRRIAALLGDKCNVALHAPTGAGKSWVADQVSDRLEAEGETVVRIDLSSGLKDGRSVFTAIAETAGHQSPSSDDLHGAWRELRRILNGRGQSLTIVLEEFDEVVRYADSLDFLKFLRELMHHPWATKSSCFIISRRPLDAIETEVRGISTLASLCVSEYLGYVTDLDLRSDWPKAADLSEVEIQECLQWSGGYAPLVRYWLSVRPDVDPSVAAEHQRVVEFERLVSHIDLLGLRDACAQLVLGPVVDDWMRQRRQLEVMGVLVPIDEESLSPSGYGSNEVFQACLRLRTWSMDPWGSLGEAEVRLRGLIDDVLTDRFGPDWHSCKELKGSRAIAAAHAAAAPKAAEDQKRFGRSASWLAYTYPQELGDIVTSTWEIFSTIFVPGDKTAWKRKFSSLAIYRTPVAHNRAEVLSEAQRAQCRIYADEILRIAIAFHEREADESRVETEE